MNYHLHGWVAVVQYALSREDISKIWKRINSKIILWYVIWMTNIQARGSFVKKKMNLLLNMKFECNSNGTYPVNSQIDGADI